MKKLFLAVAISAAAFLSACSSSDSGSGSSGVDCSDGFTKSCLKGTWYLPGLYAKGSDALLGATPAFTFGTSDVLTLSVKNASEPTAEEDFTMVFSTTEEDANGNTNSEATCGTMYGKWYISGTNTIHFSATVSECAMNSTATATLSANNDSLAFDGAYFHSSTILVSHQKTYEKFHR